MFELRSNNNNNSNKSNTIPITLAAASKSTSQHYNVSSIPPQQKLDEILNGIECIQETKEHHVKIEFNWHIADILEQINEKQPGEKIESEEFYYNKKVNGFNNESASSSSSTSLTETPDSESENEENGSFYDNHQNASDVSLLQNFLQSRNTDTVNKPAAATVVNGASDHCSCCCKRKSSSTGGSILSRKLSNGKNGSRINEFICEYFIENSNWQLELNINEYYASVADNATTCNSNEHISIHAILLASKSLTNNIIHELNIEKFKHLKDASTIDLLIKLKFYILDGKFENIYQMRTFEKEVSVLELLQSSLDLTNVKFGIDKFSSLNDLTGWLLKKSSKDFAFLCEFNIYSKNENILKKTFKHVWTIRNWKVYLIENKSYNSNDAPGDHEQKAIFKQILKFQSKSFRLRSMPQHQTCKQRMEDENFNKNHQKYIDYLLRQIKWKLQLYPRGYSTEYSNYLSLFLNFNEISKNLKDFTALKFDNRINLNELSTAAPPPTSDHDSDDEDEYRECLNEIDMILLVKPKFNTGNTVQNKNGSNQFLIKNYQETNNKLTETFVKACFQISIVDDKNKKIDICETDQQLFELYGSWGYKEYLLTNDLIEIKEKYLKNNYKNLHLNCIIKLYYTITMKFPLYSQTTVSYNYDQIKSYRSLSKYQFNSKAAANVFTSENLKYERLNSLLYDLRYLFKTSHMYDLVIQAPLELTEAAIEQQQVNSNKSQPRKFKHFKVHRLILSMRSIIFEHMFAHHDGCTGGLKPIDAIEILDFNAYTVNLFLKYLYIDSIEFDDDDDVFSESDDDDGDGNDTATREQQEQQNNDDSLKMTLTHNTAKLCKADFLVYTFIELFKIADKYCVYKLRNLCELKLIAELNSKNLINLLIVSHLYNSAKLKQSCFNYLASNLDTVVKQKRKLSYLETHYPNLLAEAFRVLYLKD